MSERKPDKGLKGGSCNREACQAPGAVWFNHSTQKYYCQACAFKLNDVNRDMAMELYGHELCTLEKLHTEKVEGPLSRRGLRVLQEVELMALDVVESVVRSSPEPFAELVYLALGRKHWTSEEEYLGHAVQAIVEDRFREKQTK